jgi:hypothetical protein
MSETINVIVREGDSFDELYLSYEKPWGTAHDFSSSVLVADIKERFSETDVVESFGIVKLSTQGQIKLALTARQTERLARIVELGYSERDISTAVVQRFGTPGETIAEFPDAVYPFLWDLKEFYYLNAATISTISQGTDLDPTPETSLFPLVITTTTPHGLTEEDSIRLSGTSVGAYNTTFANNQLVIVSSTQFYIVPLSGIPQWSQNATGGTVQVLKQDTICIGTLKVIPRISVQ